MQSSEMRTQIIFQILFIISSPFHVVNFAIPFISERGKDKIGAGGGKKGSAGGWEYSSCPTRLHLPILSAQARAAHAWDASLFLQTLVAVSRAQQMVQCMAPKWRAESGGNREGKMGSRIQVEMQPRAVFWLADGASDRCYSPLLFFK